MMAASAGQRRDLHDRNRIVGHVIYLLALLGLFSVQAYLMASFLSLDLARLRGVSEFLCVRRFETFSH